MFAPVRIKVEQVTISVDWPPAGSFYQANLGLTDENPRYEFYRPDWPIYTHQRHLAGTRVQRCRIEKGLIAEGCRIGDAEPRACSQHAHVAKFCSENHSQTPYRPTRMEMSRIARSYASDGHR